jgi:hypothetical protein
VNSMGKTQRLSDICLFGMASRYLFFIGETIIGVECKWRSSDREGL